MMSGQHPPSPCNSLCELDPASDLCVGCGRLLDEIVRWAAMNADEKRAVLRQVRARGFEVEGGSSES